jgi:hypothetical protein
MESNKTIIYYTSNQESPVFEQKIIENLKEKAGKIPIISVSRKPIKLGLNFCIGEKPVCYSSEFKQLLWGLKMASTKYCIATESDCLYPPEYFNFTPDRDDQVYRYTNLYVHFEGRDKFWKKKWVEAAQMADRHFWIKRIEKVLENQNYWDEIPVNPPFVFDTKDRFSWTGKNPVLYFKTRKGVNFKTGFEQGSVDTIPYWGTAKQVFNNYLKE